MSTYTVEKLVGEPVVLFTAHEDHDVSEGADELNDEMNELFDSLDNPVIYMIDFRAAPPLDIHDVLVSSSMATRGKNPHMHHPNVKGVVIVSTSQLVLLAAKGLDSVTFGSLKIPVFETLDEAFAYARETYR